MKQKRHSLLFALSISSIFACAPIGVSCALIKETKNSNVITDEFFEFSPDKSIIYGLSQHHTIEEIREKGFDTLSIPEGVQKISNFAFANVFAMHGTNVTNLILPSTIKEIGTGAFLNCTSFENEINFTNCVHLTTINADAFNSCQNIVGTLEFPNSLTYVGESAFRYCGGLTQIKIGSNLETVKYRAFANCSSVNIIDFLSLPRIPRWMYQEGQQIFSGTISEDVSGTLKISCRNNKISEWKDVIYNRLEITPQVTILYANELAEEYFLYQNVEDPGQLTGIKADAFVTKTIDLVRLPEKTTSIKEGAFKDIQVAPGTSCKILFNESLTKIEKYAFQNCSWIDSEIDFPDSLTDIGESAFEGSGIIGTISIPSGIQSIGNSAFKNCLGIRRVNFMMGDTKNLASLGKETFSGCTNLSILDFSAYGSNPSAGSVEFPSKWFPTIEDDKTTESPFYKISQKGYFLVHPVDLEILGLDRWEIYFSSSGDGKNYFPLDSLKKEERNPTSYDFNSDIDKQWIISTNAIDDNREVVDPHDLVIYNNVNLEGLSSGIKRSWDFKVHCDQFDVPSKIQTISDNAFKDAFLPKPVADQGETYDEPKYFVLNLNDGLINIGNYAFANCSGLFGQIIFPNSLEYIGDYAFSQCLNLRGNLIIPNSVKNIGSFAFWNCIGLSNNTLNIPSSVSKIGSEPFYGIKAKNVVLPYQTIEMGDYVFVGIEGLQSIDLRSISSTSLGGHMPSEVYKWSKFAFSSLTSSGGEILVKKILTVTGDCFNWTEWLQSCGLPSTWNIIEED